MFLVAPLWAERGSTTRPPIRWLSGHVQPNPWLVAYGRTFTRHNRRDRTGWDDGRHWTFSRRACCEPAPVRSAWPPTLAAPIVAALRPWLEAQLSRIPRASKLAEDIRYTLGIWPGLTRFLEDGRLELDTNPVENQIRPIALTRKTALFAGHEVGADTWARLASLVATCKMSDVNPVDYLADTLRALLDGRPKRRIEELMPWQFRRAPSLAAQAPGEVLTAKRSSSRT